MSAVTRILEAIQAGQTQAAEELLPLVYGELRRILIEKARRRQRVRHGAGLDRVELDDLQVRGC